MFFFFFLFVSDAFVAGGGIDRAGIAQGSEQGAKALVLPQGETVVVVVVHKV